MSLTLNGWTRTPSPIVHQPEIPPLSPIERLPKWLLCIPLVLNWMALAVRYRSLTLPSATNPTIATGGLAGEGKLDCLGLIRPEHAPWVAPSWPVRPGMDPETVRRAAGLDFPLIAKPDIGWCGYGVRRIASTAELRDYAAHLSTFTYILQPLIPGPVEVGLLYRRNPGQPGRLVSVTRRHPPSITGDGRRTIAQLIAADPRLQNHSAAIHTPGIPRSGRTIPLTTVASLRVGGRYEDAPHLITPALQRAVNAIALGMGQFHAGRFDVRAPSLEALRAGEFTIIEVNGAGAEAINAWDPRYTLLQAFAIVLRNHQALFALGNAMRHAGHRPVGWRRLAAAWLKQQRIARSLPGSN